MKNKKRPILTTLFTLTLFIISTAVSAASPESLFARDTDSLAKLKIAPSIDDFKSLKNKDTFSYKGVKYTLKVKETEFSAYGFDPIRKQYFLHGVSYRYDKVGENYIINTIKQYHFGKLNGYVITTKYKSPIVTAIKQYKDGKTHGEQLAFYSDGKLRERTHRYEGKLHGKRIFYFKSGRKEDESAYIHGSAEGKSTRYNRDGTVSATALYKNNQRVDK